MIAVIPSLTRALPTVLPDSGATSRQAVALSEAHRHVHGKRAQVLVDGSSELAQGVYVFPQLAQSVAELRLLTEAECTFMSELTDEINRMTDAAFEQVLAYLGEAAAYAVAQAEYEQFVDEHSEELAAAEACELTEAALRDALDEAQALLNAIDAELASCAGDATRQATLNAQRTGAQASFDAARAEWLALQEDESCGVAYAVRDQAQTLIAEVSSSGAALAAEFDTELDSLLVAINMAVDSFNSLATQDAAEGPMAFPVFDEGILSFIASQNQVSTLQPWQKGRLENLTWSVPAGIRLDTSPFTFTAYERVGNMLLPALDLPIGEPPSDVTPGHTTVEVMTHDEQGKLLEIPQVRVVLGMGTLCGHLEEERIESPNRLVLDKTKWEVGAIKRRLRFVPNPRPELFKQMAVASFDTPVRGPVVEVPCARQKVVSPVHEVDNVLAFKTHTVPPELEQAARWTASTTKDLRFSYPAAGPSLRPWAISPLLQKRLDALRRENIQCSFPWQLQRDYPELEAELMGHFERAAYGALAYFETPAKVNVREDFVGIKGTSVSVREPVVIRKVESIAKKTAVPALSPNGQTLGATSPAWSTVHATKAGDVQIKPGQYRYRGSSLYRKPMQFESSSAFVVGGP